MEETEENTRKWKEQESIPHERVMMFLACAIYYDFNMAAIMRFVGNNYTAAYRNVPKIMQYLHDGNVSEDVCKDVERIFTVGCPSYAKGHFSRNNFLQYKCLYYLYIIFSFPSLLGL